MGWKKGQKNPAAAEALRRKWRSAEFRDKMTKLFQKQGRDPAFREMRSQSAKENAQRLWQDPAYVEQRAALHRAGRIGRGLSKQERIMATLLGEMQIDYQSQPFIEGYPGVPDFLLTKVGIVLEIDNRGHLLTKLQDRKRTRLLQSLGYTVLRITYKEMEDLKAVGERIQGYVGAQ